MQTKTVDIVKLFKEKKYSKIISIFDNIIPENQNINITSTTKFTRRLYSRIKNRMSTAIRRPHLGYSQSMILKKHTLGGKRTTEWFRRAGSKILLRYQYYYLSMIDQPKSTQIVTVNFLKKYYQFMMKIARSYFSTQMKN